MREALTSIQESVDRDRRRTRLKSESKGLGVKGVCERGLEEPSIRVAAAFVSNQATSSRSRPFSIWSWRRRVPSEEMPLIPRPRQPRLPEVEFPPRLPRIRERL